MGEPFQIRKAILSDADSIARVHVDSWRSTYKGIVDQKFLDNLNYSNRVSMWKRMIEKPSKGQTTLVAIVNNEVVGFVDVGKIREPIEDFDGELMAIYLFQELQGKGIGRVIFREAMKSLKESGFSSMMLWVLKDNRTKLFYEKMGGKFMDSKYIKIGEQNLEEHCYGWRSL